MPWWIICRTAHTCTKVAACRLLCTVWKDCDFFSCLHLVTILVAAKSKIIKVRGRWFTLIWWQMCNTLVFVIHHSGLAWGWWTYHRCFQWSKGQPEVHVHPGATLQAPLPQWPCGHAGGHPQPHIHHTGDTFCLTLLQHLWENDLTLCQGVNGHCIFLSAGRAGSTQLAGPKIANCGLLLWVSV